MDEINIGELVRKHDLHNPDSLVKYLLGKRKVRSTVDFTDKHAIAEWRTSHGEPHTEFHDDGNMYILSDKKTVSPVFLIWLELLNNGYLGLKDDSRKIVVDYVKDVIRMASIGLSEKAFLDFYAEHSESEVISENLTIRDIFIPYNVSFGKTPRLADDITLCKAVASYLGEHYESQHIGEDIVSLYFMAQSEGFVRTRVLLEEAMLRKMTPRIARQEVLGIYDKSMRYRTDIDTGPLEEGLKMIERLWSEETDKAFKKAMGKNNFLNTEEKIEVFRTSPGLFIDSYMGGFSKN